MLSISAGYLRSLFPCLGIAIQEGGVQSQLFAVAPHHRVQQGIQHLEPHLIRDNLEQISYVRHGKDDIE